MDMIHPPMNITFLGLWIVASLRLWFVEISFSLVRYELTVDIQHVYTTVEDNDSMEASFRKASCLIRNTRTCSNHVSHLYRQPAITEKIHRPYLPSLPSQTHCRRQHNWSGTI